MAKRLNLDEPRYYQNNFEGRAKHFFATTNPLNVLASDAELDKAKAIVTAYRAGTEDKLLTEDDIWKAKELYDSAFHPQTGEKLLVFGRMSFQVKPFNLTRHIFDVMCPNFDLLLQLLKVPGNMCITGCMMTFYKSTPAVMFWQFANQSFNAIVNYTNRNASAGVTNEQLGTVYVAATSASVATALAFNKLVASSPTLANSIVGRFVPLIAVASANCINIPLMRQQEIKQGIAIQDETGKDVGKSGNAAIEAIKQVVPSRIGMAAPAMFIPPVIMNKLEKTATFIKNPWLKAPATVLLTGFCLTFSTPLCCALFPQKATIQMNQLEPELQATLKATYPGKTTFYYNKGL